MCPVHFSGSYVRLRTKGWCRCLFCDDERLYFYDSACKQRRVCARGTKDECPLAKVASAQNNKRGSALATPIYGDCLSKLQQFQQPQMRYNIMNSARIKSDAKLTWELEGQGTGQRVRYPGLVERVAEVEVTPVAEVEGVERLVSCNIDNCLFICR